MRSNSSTPMSATLGSTRSRSANIAQNVRSIRSRPNECGSIPSSGRAKRTSQCQSRRMNAIAGLSSASALTRSGRSRPTSIATRPPIELPTMWARSMFSASIVPITARAAYGAP